MAYDEGLAERIEDVLAAEADVTTRRMFGGLAFMVAGHMTVAATEGGMMVRTDPTGAPELLREPAVTQVEMRGRPMSGWLLVAHDALAEEDALRTWVDRSVAHVRSLPPKHG